MKEAISSVSLFQIVIVFLLLFTGVMCLTINHSKAFGVKDEIINIIESAKLASPGSTYNYALEDTTIEDIVDKLNEAGYRITGKCPSGWTGYDRNGNTVSGDQAAFCVRVVDVSEAYYEDTVDKCRNGKCDVTYGDYPSMIYYDIALFYQLDIPIINDIMNFKLYGSTKVLFGDL